MYVWEPGHGNDRIRDDEGANVLRLGNGVGADDVKVSRDADNLYCGRHGCLEQYASAKGLVWLYRQECRRQGVEGVKVEHDTDTLSVFAALKAGDECAETAVIKMCEYLREVPQGEDRTPAHVSLRAERKHARIEAVSSGSRRQIEERRVGKECRSRWSPYH